MGSIINLHNIGPHGCSSVSHTDFIEFAWELFKWIERTWHLLLMGQSIHEVCCERIGDTFAHIEGSHCWIFTQNKDEVGGFHVWHSGVTIESSSAFAANPNLLKLFLISSTSLFTTIYHTWTKQTISWDLTNHVKVLSSKTIFQIIKAKEKRKWAKSFISTRVPD